LLGRDFLSPATIGIHVGCGRWSIGLEPDIIYPFIPNKSNIVALTELEIVDPLKDDQNQLYQLSPSKSVFDSKSELSIDDVDLISFAEDEDDTCDQFA